MKVYLVHGSNLSQTTTTINHIMTECSVFRYEFF
jgi:hypothetical protein